ncbi:MAG: sulfate ABC transporter ATP-binding protein [Myxococcota bacterium]|jgi:sulfate transport system ATP-binding protein|nr:sulfate ABC transporter ATP-binding protein [Myxococcota bacterium]
MGIEVTNLTKRFGDFVAVEDVSFRIEKGRLAALLGPSGGGKSTILRIIAGLEVAENGSVLLDGERVDHLHTRKRDMGFVFQHYALFRHMTVGQNIGFGLEVRGVASRDRRRKVGRMLELVGLPGLGNRYPHELSGGQRQRVALARALATEPRLLLLDEPFGAVDAKIRAELGRWLRTMHDEINVTSIFVTHDQEEAMSLSDQVLIISQGRLEQVGSPVEILDHPRTEFVARFVGDVNVFDGVVRQGRAEFGPLAFPIKHAQDGAAVRVVVRSYDFELYPDASGPATVQRVLPLGDRVKVDAIIDGLGPISAQFPRSNPFAEHVLPGTRVGVGVSHARSYTLQ